MDKTRRLSELVMQKHPEAFGTDYEKNKKALEELAVIPSKQLRNHMAGYIAKVLKSGTDTEAEAETEAEVKGEEEADQPKAE